MARLSRREWVDLVCTHPCPDPANPTDEFAQALIEATGGDPDVWVHGTETEALEAYEVAWGKRPDHRWATTFLEGHPDVHLELNLCTEAGIPYTQFLGWDAQSQDLFIAAGLLRADTCPRGHSRALQVDEDASRAERVRCAACAHAEDLDRLVAKATEHAPESKDRMGWTTRVVPT